MKRNVFQKNVGSFLNYNLHFRTLYLILFLTLSYTTNAQMPSSSKEDIWHKNGLRILDIGNSYTEDAVSFLSSMVSQANIETKDICMYALLRGAGSFATWVNTYHGSDNYNYNCRKVFGELQPNIPIAGRNAAPYDSTLFHDVLDNCQWDVIIIHQYSGYAPYYDQYDGLSELLSIIKKHQKDALIGTYLVHSYWDEYSNNKEKSSEKRWNLIAQATKQMCEDYNIDFVIPYGTAIENLRQTSYNKEKDLTLEGTHLGTGLAQYTASCCYFESILKKRYNVSISDIDMRYTVNSSDQNTYGEGCVDVTEENNIIAHKAALYALDDMYSLRNPENDIYEVKNISDGEEYKNEYETHCNNLNYTRTFNNTSWQSLYIPFSMSYDDWKADFDIAYINSIRQYDNNSDGTIDETIMDIIKIENGFLIANTPYLIRAKSTGEKTITLGNTTIYPAESNNVDCSTTIAKFTFTGTYAPIPSSTMAENSYYGMGGGSLVHTDGTSDLKPFRWYLKIDDRSPMYNISNNAKAITIKVAGEDEKTTGIITTKPLSRSTNFFDINGRIVNKSTMKPAIYIKNRKKVIII